MIKYCYNILLEGKEQPETKISTLYLLKDLLESCEVPCVNLIEIYILPIIYEIAIYKTQLRAHVRGNLFFHNNGYSARLPNLEENGIKFVAFCT